MNRLEQLRTDAKLTPEQLGAAAHVAGETVRRIERGKRAFPSTLGKLADYFGVPASDLQREALPVSALSEVAA